MSASWFVPDLFRFWSGISTFNFWLKLFYWLKAKAFCISMKNVPSGFQKTKVLLSPGTRRLGCTNPGGRTKTPSESTRTSESGRTLEVAMKSVQRPGCMAFCKVIQCLEDFPCCLHSFPFTEHSISFTRGLQREKLRPMNLPDLPCWWQPLRGLLTRYSSSRHETAEQSSLKTPRWGCGRGAKQRGPKETSHLHGPGARRQIRSSLNLKAWPSPVFIATG